MFASYYGYESLVEALLRRNAQLNVQDQVSPLRSALSSSFY